MNRPFDDDAPDPRLEMLSTGDAPADVQARAHAALAGLREKMDRVETEKESLIMRIFIANRWARLGWAGSLAVVLFVCYIVFGPNKSGVAFAEVAARMRSIKTMVYTSIIEINPKATDEFATHLRKMPQGPGKIYYKEPGRVRQEMNGGIGIILMDLKNRKHVSITPMAKMYMEIEMTSGPMETSTFIQRMLTMPSRADKVLGSNEIDGKTLWGFVVTQGGIEQTVWADPATGFPGRIEIPIPQSPGSKLVMKDFKYDVPLKDSLFDMKVPEGYTRMSMKVERPTEKDVLNCLKDWTEADPKHEFPATFTAITMTQMPKKMEEKFKGPDDDKPNVDVPKPARGTKETTSSVYAKALKSYQDEVKANPKKMQNQIDVVMKMMMPFQFPTDIETHGGEWHYAGKGVKLGEARPVCWWKQKKSDTTWRVIYGDLKINDMPQEDMTKFLESIKRIDNATK